MQHSPKKHILEALHGKECMDVKNFRNIALYSASAALSTLALIACGELDLSKQAEALLPEETVNSQIDQTNCKTVNDGDIKYDAAEDKYYHCIDGNWKEVNVEIDINVSYASSSSSKKRSSSSSKSNFFFDDDEHVISLHRSSSSKNVGLFDDDSSVDIDVPADPGPESSADEESPVNSATGSTPEDSETETPENPETEIPESSETATPENPETITPESSTTVTAENPETIIPESSETVTPENPETEIPESSTTVTPENPETITPESSETTADNKESSSSKTPAANTSSATNANSSAGEDISCKENDKYKSENSGKYFICLDGQWEEIADENWQIVESSSSADAVTVIGELNQTVAKNADITPVVFKNVTKEPQRSWNIYFVQGTYDQNAKTYTLKGKVPDYLSNGTTLSDTYTFENNSFIFTLTIAGSPEPSGTSSNSIQPSSSSATHSSSSQQASSSSAKPASSSAIQSSSSQQQGSLLPKIIDNNKKTGYATRYWDSCKPHCAWEGKGGPIARTCKNDDGITRASSDAKSVCDPNGTAGTCFDQTPQIVNDTIAYAFAATPGGGNDCGKCYMLTFKGTGASATNTSTDDHHRKIKGKHLIVMSSNIGYDVSHNQFDLMIPGGGPGAFNGCKAMGISCAGEQYGGFLATCDYNKQCLIEMCKKEYSNPSLQQGCLFLANWMDAANNPEVEFVQVECPAALVAKY